VANRTGYLILSLISASSDIIIQAHAPLKQIISPMLFPEAQLKTENAKNSKAIIK
jgi:hypothetical protein